MINSIGNILLIITIISGIMNIFFFKKKNISFLFFSLQTFSLIVSFFLLILATVNDDFSNPVALFSSEKSLPLFYKIASSWSNHSGSILFWASLMALFFILYMANSKISRDLKFAFLTHSSHILLFFSIFIYFASNPFSPTYANFLDGQGLNPILQDVALAIHPPILFTSYSLLAIIYCQALVILSRKEDIPSIKKEMRLIISFAFSLSTFAIALGSWWAYRELGWGGYWFWDPVENLSLLPWLILLMLIHSATKNNLFQFTVTLSLIGFLSSIISSLLIRSGILTSVHSFAVDNEKAVYIVIMFLSFVIYSLIFFFRKESEFWQVKRLNKISFLLLSQMIFTFFFFTIIILGTIYPLIHNLFFNEVISIGEKYYQNLLKIILIPILFFMSLASGINNRLSKEYLLKISILFMVVLLTGKMLFYLLTPITIINLILLLMVITVILSLYFAFKRHKSMFLGHLGFSLVILAAIIQNSLYYEAQIKLENSNYQTINGNFEINYKGIENSMESNLASLKLKASLIKNKKEISPIEPEIHFFPKQRIKTSEVYIARYLFLHDIYTTIEFDSDNKIILRIKYNSFMSIIWLGIILIIISSFKKEKFYV